MMKSGMRASNKENLPESRQAWTTGPTHHFPEDSVKTRGVQSY